MARIVSVEIARVDYPLVGEFKFFKTQARPTVVLRLVDENGIEGFGQSVPIETWTYETPESVESTLRDYLAPMILGADPSDIADIHARMERSIRPSFSIGQPLAKAAIDLACYDLWGRQTKKPVTALLGGARTDRVRLSWTINAPTLAGAETLLAQGRALGKNKINVKDGNPQSTTYDVDLVRL